MKCWSITVLAAAFLGISAVAVGSVDAKPFPRASSTVSPKPKPSPTTKPKKKSTKHGGSSKSKAVTVTPSKGGEGTKITLTFPSPPPRSLSHTMFFHDPGAHGWVIEHGAGVWIAWDAHRGLTYPSSAHRKGHKRASYTALVPFGICGITIKPKQATITAVPGGLIQSSLTKVPNAYLKSNQGVTTIGQRITQYPDKSKPAKTLQVWLDAQKSKAATFGLLCDSYSLSVTLKANPKKIEVPPLGTSGLTGTFVAKGPAQFINGRRITSAQKRKALQAIMPFKGLSVYFHDNPGPWTMNPPAGTVLPTDSQGQVHSTISSDKPGIAQVQVIATGFGDANAPVRFYTPSPSPSPSPKPRAGLNALPPLPLPVLRNVRPLVYFGANETAIRAHNGNLYGSGWGTQLYGGVQWAHFNDTLYWNRVNVTFDQGDWSDDDWGDDFDYDWDLDWPDGQFADVYLGPTYQHLGFDDMGFRYSGNGLGVNTGFDWQTQPRLGIYGRATYLPTVTTDYSLTGGDKYQLSKQAYDFGVRFTLSPSNDFYLKAGFNSEIFQSKNSQSGGGIYNSGPYLGLQYLTH